MEGPNKYMNPYPNQDLGDVGLPNMGLGVGGMNLRVCAWLKHYISYKHITDKKKGPNVPWKMEVPSKLQLFCWRERIHKFMNQIDPIYVLRKSENESINHLFATCPVVVSIWNCLPWIVPKPSSISSFSEWF